ncbi:MAG: redoxin domain-containing protein [Bacteroidia bacterium]|nr:redoxin domain-containing protein [Bacteroidia bacterium]
MKKLLFTSLPIAMLAMFSLNPSEGPLKIGSTIPNPEVKMKDISDAEISFKDAMKKNGLLVMFSCNTCPIVKRYQSRTIEVCRYAAKNDIGVILLNSNEAFRNNGDSFSDMKDYAKDQHYDFSYVVDKNSAMADVFGANRTPELYLFNKDKILVYHGAIDDNANSPGEATRKHAILAIDEMALGKEISIKETRSVGCSIKRK